MLFMNLIFTITTNNITS